MGKRMGDHFFDNAVKASQWVAAAVTGLWFALPELTELLIALMATDVILGFVKAWKDRDVSPAKAFSGVTKKMVTLLMIGVFALIDHYADDVLHLNLMQAGSAFYLIPELTSIMHHAAALDVPVFNQLQGVLRYFQTASGGDTPEREEDKPNE